MDILRKTRKTVEHLTNLACTDKKVPQNHWIAICHYSILSAEGVECVKDSEDHSTQVNT